MAEAVSIEDLAIIDVDAHITEPHDLWTSRAPAAYRDRMPRVTEVDGQRAWVVDGDVQLSSAIASSVVGEDGAKSRGVEFFNWQIEDVHVASYDMQARLGLLDRFGIHTQIIYPNVAGFGNQNFMKVDDRDLRRACATIYNDAMAEIQADTGERILPMALMPWWNIEDSIAEVSRAAEMGLRGIVMCSDPDSIGLPDLADEAWLPFWEACSSEQMPVNFHIGASETSFNMFGRAAWPSMGMRRRLALGSSSLFMENSRVLSNMLYSGILERFPELKLVSVESGIGWIPFMLEALDYEWSETASHEECKLAMPASDLRLLLVREDGAEVAHRGDRRGQPAVRDRLPAPDLPVPRREGVSGRCDRGLERYHAPQDPAGQRGGAVPGEASRCRVLARVWAPRTTTP